MMSRIISGLKFTDIMQICMLTALLLFVSISFNVFDFMQTISYLVWAACCLSFGIMLIFFTRKPVISYFDLTIAAYMLLLITFTILNGTDVKSAIYKSIEVFLLLMIVNYKHNIRLIAKTCATVLSCCAYTNLAIMIIFPNWMFAAKDTFDSHLLGGNYNQIGSRLITAIILSIICTKISKKWIINTVLLIIVSIVTLALVGSMTSLSCILLFSIFCLIPSIKLQKVGVVAFFLFFILFQCTVVFSGEGLHNNPYAVYIIEDVLQKDITFTNRTELWDAAGKMFVESPLIGYGFVDSDWYVSNMNSFAIGPHNFIYSVLINGGLTLLCVLIIMCLTALRNILRNYDKIAVILLMGIATLFFMMTMEVYPFFFLFTLLYFTYHYSQLSSPDRISQKEPQHA